MSIVRRFLGAFRGMRRKAQIGADLETEMRSHIEMRTQQNVDAGMDPKEARYAALRKFGWLESIKEDCRDQRGVRWLENLVQDTQFGKHPFAVKEKVCLADLENERFILMKDGHCLGGQILTFCTKNDLRLQIMLRSSQIETIQSLVMAGLGMSLVPQMARISGRTPLVYRSLENPTPTRTIVVIWRKGREHTRASAEFLKHLQQSAKASRETLKTTE